MNHKTLTLAVTLAPRLPAALPATAAPPQPSTPPQQPKTPAPPGATTTTTPNPMRIGTKVVALHMPT
jgi:hypothetical protein